MPDADTATETALPEDITTAGDELDNPDAPSEVDEVGNQFPREYVEKIRKESAGYRDRAKTAEARADELARALFTARVAATGKLADATDLAYDPSLLDDAEALAGAVDALIESKPHLKSRKASGSIGQGARGHESSEFSLLGRLKENS